MLQQNKLPGMSCPECNSFIHMPVEGILSAASFSCPNPQCSVEMKLDGRQSSRSLDALERYAKAMKDLGYGV